MKVIKELLPEQKIPERKNYYLLPGMTPADFKETLDNYEIYVLKYNTAIEKLNKEIANYNKNYKNLDDKNQAEAERLEKLFKDVKNITAYNKKVEQTNKLYGKHILKKRKYQKIKYASQRIFVEILKHQARTINNQNRQNIKLGITTRIEKSAVITMKLWNSKVALKLQISNKTVYNHIRRLLSAGILTNYKFNGTNKGFTIAINPKLLKISDLANITRQNVENQFFKTGQKKKLQDNIIVQQEHYKKNKKNSNVKDNANKVLPKQQLNTYPPKSDKTRTTTGTHQASSGNVVKPEHRTAGENLNKFQKRSKLLYIRMLQYIILAKKLTEGFFDNYKPIRNTILKQEVLYGLLSREQFRDLMIQELIKTAAKLWKDWKFGNIYEGEWIKTYKILQSNYFFTNNGNIPNKDTMLKMLIDYKYRLKVANDYKRIKPEWNPTNPSNYFNPHLKTSGFAGTKKFLTKKRQKQKLQQKQQSELKRNAYKKEMQNQLWKRIEYRIKKHWDGKMTATELQNWLHYNAPEVTASQIREFVSRIAKTYKKQ